MSDPRHVEGVYCSCYECGIKRWGHCSGGRACTCWRCMPFKRALRGRTWSQKDDAWVREQVERNLDYVVFRLLLDGVGAYEPTEYDPAVHGDWESAAPRVWEWLRDTFYRVGAAHCLPRLRRSLDRVLEHGAPVDMRESQSEVDYAVDRQFDDDWGWAIVDALARCPNEDQPLTRSDSLGALVLALVVLAATTPGFPAGTDPVPPERLHHRATTAPIVRTGPPARTWALLPQVLPAAA